MMTCGNSDRPSSTSWILLLRAICAELRASGFQKVVSLTQYASRASFSLKPKACAISMVRQAMPSACPTSRGPSFRSAMAKRMSGNAASCAANIRPAGPHPMMSTSSSSGIRSP